MCAGKIYIDFFSSMLAEISLRRTAIAGNVLRLYNRFNVVKAACYALVIFCELKR